ncbi:MAG: hypothetical protein KAQ67_07220, partial [Gammaproteobacteria bacterium]|nr:hypothetical protein [Gammaproteobacteria bacterium]
MKINVFIFSCLLAAVSGCARFPTGPTYQEYIASTSKVSNEDARVYIFRTIDEIPCTRESTITLDNNEKGLLLCGSYLFFDIATGQHQLTVSTSDLFSKCTINFNITNNDSYYFRVVTRTSAFWQSFIANFMGGVAGFTGVIGTQMTAQGLDSLDDCSGFFGIVPVDKQKAQKLIKDLRLIVTDEADQEIKSPIIKSSAIDQTGQLTTLFGGRIHERGTDSRL